MNEVGKKELAFLLHNTWIVKENDVEQYYAIKHQLHTIKPFITEQLGSKLIVHPRFIKLEKVPIMAKNYMGIDNFEDPLEYVLLMLVLLYLEDKPAGEQFVLSWVADFIKTTALSLELDHMPNWDLTQHRKCLVKVIRYLTAISVIKVCEEEKISFIENAQADGLYQTTGISNYLVRIFKNDIFKYQTVADFEEDEWMDQNIDKGEIRRYRIYRSLMYTPAVYHVDLLESDIDYIKKQRYKMKQDFEQYTDAELEVTKNMSIIFYPNVNQKQYFPNNKTISDVVLMVNYKLQNEIAAGTIRLDDNEIATVNKTYMERLLKELKDEKQFCLSKLHQKLPLEKFCREVLSYMEQYGFIEACEHGYRLYPMIGRLVGTINEKKEEPYGEQINMFGGNDNETVHTG